MDEPLDLVLVSWRLLVYWGQPEDLEVPDAGVLTLKQVGTEIQLRCKKGRYELKCT
jgi:hypothetical protein